MRISIWIKELIVIKKGIIYVYFNRAKYEKEGVEKYYVGQTIKTMVEEIGDKKELDEVNKYILIRKLEGESW